MNADFSETGLLQSVYAYVEQVFTHRECHPAAPGPLGTGWRWGGVHVSVTSQVFEHPLQK